MPLLLRGVGPRAACEGLHIGDYVTVELRRSYKMSHQRGANGCWHACCIYHYRRPKRPREGSKQGGIRRTGPGAALSFAPRSRRPN